MEIKNKKIYVMLSETGTVTSKILRCFTKAPYNHVSISMEEDLSVSYSFARRWKYYPLIGGFMRETPYEGVFGRFPDTKVLAISFMVTETQYEGIKGRLAEMFGKQKRYHYDWIGLLLGLFNKRWKRKYHYFCSAFVKDLLVDFGVIQDADLPRVPRPYDFYLTYGENKIYEGKLREFAPEQTEEKQKDKIA